MKGAVILDTNLLLLLVVGAADRSYIARHKRLGSYTEDDFDLLTFLVAEYDELVVLPHVLAEVSNLARQINGPARAHIHAALATLIEMTIELPIHSADGASRAEFQALGLTDAVLLHACEVTNSAAPTTIITSDASLANAAHALGYSIVDYKQQFQDR